jgi:hypothetical protein
MNKEAGASLCGAGSFQVNMTFSSDDYVFNIDEEGGKE